MDNQAGNSGSDSVEFIIKNKNIFEVFQRNDGKRNR